MDSEIIAQSLQRVIDSNKWKSLLKVIDEYVQDRGKSADNRMLQSVKNLIAYGREDPVKWQRLKEFAFRIKTLNVDSEILVKYRGEDISAALDKLFSGDRPQRTIDSIVVLAQNPNPAKYDSPVMNKNDGLKILRLLACNDLPFFLELVNSRNVMRDAARLDYYKKFRDNVKERKEHVAAALELIFRCRRLPTDAEVNEAYDQLRRGRDVFMRSALKDGRSSRKAIAFYWEQVDKELETIGKLLAAHKAGAKVNMEMVTLPRVRYSSEMKF